MGLGGAYRLGGDFKVIIGRERGRGWGAKHKVLRPLETPCKDFDSAIGGGLGWMKWL